MPAAAHPVPNDRPLWSVAPRTLPSPWRSASFWVAYGLVMPVAAVVRVGRLLH